MNIFYFHHGLWPSNAPSTTFVTYNALGFLHAGHALNLVTVRNNTLSVKQTLTDTFKIMDFVPVTLIYAAPFKRQHRYIYLRALLYLLRQDMDILITRNLSFLPFALLIKKLKPGLKIIFETHDFYSDPSLRHDGKNKKIQKKCRQEHAYLPRIDGLICVSEQQRKYYVQQYPSLPIVAAVTGVKRILANQSSHTLTGTLGYIGSFSSKDYDIDFLLHVIAAVKDKNIKLIVVGGKNEKECAKVRKKAEFLEIADRVEVQRWLSPADLEKVKSQIDIGCCPMKNHFFNSIKSPLKVLEYFSAGKPVLVTDLGSFRFVVRDGENGYLLKNDVLVWTNVLEQMYADTAQYSKFAEASLATAREYAWDRRAAHIVQFCKELK